MEPNVAAERRRSYGIGGAGNMRFATDVAKLEVTPSNSSSESVSYHLPSGAFRH
ncbi:hypothetical protein BAUCODRAFT_30022 [Baudoinia panamericana UAMH 10762]|uniref:Uncharacterized protein n=1 Tax=Baudoinia panamericana (strain UAMH 10762) TaxID=717646 RepID=M2MS30_BAUPA|nr:uncharacterized protein BAUCODRAFT_30022 [Baudoinia panamericana UAMH 10762]EMC99651.1 hypothetical protein BAUCODRAFT_30022 [Baudoinia panamericana UAMH 10762]